LANNSRSGLTVRFLSKKLEIPEEEVEYLVDVNHRFLFTDLTKIKIAPEGITAVKRIVRGLENRGDVPSLFRCVKALSAQEFRELEDLAGVDGPSAKKRLAEEMLERHYCHPEAVLAYIATRGFSPTARELFDLVWNSKEGVMPVSRLRALHGGPEYEVEQGIAGLFRGLGLFEMFRFDAEDRLLRMSGLLAELRQWRKEQARRLGGRVRLKAFRGTPDAIVSHRLSFSDRICRLVAAIAAKPARLRGDGDLFREDRRRLSEICPEEAEPSLNTCLWVAQGVGWLARVDNELRAGELEPLISLNRVRRAKILSDWLLSAEREECPGAALHVLWDELKPGKWYRTVEAVRYAMTVRAEDEQPILKGSGGHWHYVSPSALSHSERALVRAFEETLPWLGIVDCAEGDGDSLFRVTDLGMCLMGEGNADLFAASLPETAAHIIVQPNFDIVVPAEEMDPLLTVPLDQFAERMSTGKATVYHVSKESFTRAVQEGHDSDAFVGFLLEHNRGGRLPSNVMTTLDDWRGGMKRVRLRTIQVLESDDPLVLADVLHRRKFKKHMAAVNPRSMATYSKISKAELARQLEKEGFVVE
ncbi:MAG: hypothetical protein GWP08_15635, partial [Nitrospiraceae bacterium]|nr:hypothetical protein [Nitrospiraceae bacterium]